MYTVLYCAVGRIPGNLWTYPGKHVQNTVCQCSVGSYRTLLFGFYGFSVSNKCIWNGKIITKDQSRKGGFLEFDDFLCRNECWGPRKEKK
jgi:hypothetical protein